MVVRRAFSLVLLMILYPPSILQEKRSGTVRTGTVRIKLVAPVSSTTSPSPSTMIVKCVCKSLGLQPVLCAVSHRGRVNAQASARAAVRRGDTPENARGERNESVNVCVIHGALSTCHNPHRGSCGLLLAALRTIVSRMRCSKWAVGLSLTVTRRRAAMGGFTQDG
jgi:hypothetical protein